MKITANYQQLTSKGVALTLHGKADVGKRITVTIVGMFDSGADAKAWHKHKLDAIRMNLAALERICGK